MSVMLFGSVLTTTYGAWHFDLVVLLVPVIEAAAWVVRDGRRRVVGLAMIGFLVLNSLAFMLNVCRLKWGIGSVGFIWLAPALMLAYFALHRCCQRGPAGADRWPSGIANILKTSATTLTRTTACSSASCPPPV